MKESRILKPNEVKVLLQVVDRLYPDMIPFLVLAMFEGIRPEDILLLNWKDINLANGVVQVTDAHNGRKMDKETHDLVRLWLSMRIKKEGAVAPAFALRTILRHLNHCARQAGILDWTPYSLRRTFCSYYAPGYVKVNAADVTAFWNLTPGCLFLEGSMISIRDL